jgi:hypothetical protein
VNGSTGQARSRASGSLDRRNAMVMAGFVPAIAV